MAVLSWGKMLRSHQMLKHVTPYHQFYLELDTPVVNHRASQAWTSA